MARGAHSAGLVTYSAEDSSAGLRGCRSRVVNGKRSDLSLLLLEKFQAALERRRPLDSDASIRAPQLFQGHTRFATSSLVDLGGCHPHQWAPPSKMLHWEWDNAARCFISRQQNVEGFITHNGDLDFYQFVPGGRFYSTDEIMLILEHMLGHRRPSEVDSVAIAGLLDLTRTAGLWGASARLGYLSSGVSPSVDLVEAIEEGQLLGCHALVKVGQ
eukprot:6201615-Pleurochrysis_carterae.AAC.7